MCAYWHTHIRKIRAYNTRMRSSDISDLHCTWSWQDFHSCNNWRVQWKRGVEHFTQKWTFWKRLWILSVVLFSCVKQCSACILPEVCFLFLRYWIQIGIRQSISTEAYGGTMSCVAVEANCRFAVFAATLMYESRCRFMGLIGPASDMLFFWPFLHHFWHKWLQPCRFSVLVVPAASTGFCCLKGLPIAWCKYCMISSHTCKRSINWSLAWGWPLHPTPVVSLP